MKRATLDALLSLRAVGQPAALVKDLASGRECLITADTSIGDLPVEADLQTRAHAAIARDRSELVETADGRLFIQVFQPPSRLIIVGAVHISQALAPMATLAGYAVTIVDPRRALLQRKPFDEIVSTDAWPDKALQTLRPDTRTAVVVLSHDPKIDDPALVAALKSDAFYVGALGSQKSHAKRRDRLAAAGIDDDTFARVHGPVGLAIGALTPAEIAVSILAEMTQIRRRGGAP